MWRVRVALRTGVLWALAGSAAGFVLARVSTFNPDLPFALLFAPLAFVSGVICAGLLTGASGRGASPAVRACFGALSGLLVATVIAATAAASGGRAWDDFVLFGPGLVFGSAVCAACTTLPTRSSAPTGR